MQISGQIKTACPPEVLVQNLHSVDLWSRLLPPGSQIETQGPGEFAFSLTKKIGPIRLILPGTMVLQHGTGHDQTLTLRAAHMVGGKVDLALSMAITRVAKQTILDYTGDLSASGLAGRILGEYESQLNDVVKRNFVRLRLNSEQMWDNQGLMA